MLNVNLKFIDAKKFCELKNKLCNCTFLDHKMAHGFEQLLNTLSVKKIMIYSSELFLTQFKIILRM